MWAQPMPSTLGCIGFTCWSITGHEAIAWDPSYSFLGVQPAQWPELQLQRLLLVRNFL